MTDTTPNAEVEQLRNQLDALRASDPAPEVAAAKQRASDAVSNAAASVSEAVATPVRQGMDQVRGAVASARRTAAQVGAQKESLSQQIRGRPLLAVGAAVLTGYVFGRAVR